MSRLLQEVLNRLPPDEARSYFLGWRADTAARFIIVDLAMDIYAGSGPTDENAAVASLMHAADYLDDRIGYEMEPHPKGMIRLPQEPAQRSPDACTI